MAVRSDTLAAMAGHIPEQFIDDLLTRTDIVDLIEDRVPLKKAGRDYTACCPFHQEKTASFTVSPSKQFYHCFGCGAHGNAIGFLMNYDHLDFVETVKTLAARAGLIIPESRSVSEKKTKNTENLSTCLLQAKHYFQQQLRQHPQRQRIVDYLKNRGISGEIAARFELGFAPDSWQGLLEQLGTSSTRIQLLEQAGLVVRKNPQRVYDRFRSRMMFPINNRQGQLVGFGARALGDEQPKYLNSPETPLFHKNAELYHLHAARDAITQAQQSLVVEGYMDVIGLAQHGIDNTVATLGTATSSTHLQRLLRLAPDIIFCFDGDRAGRQAAWHALETALPLLRDGVLISFLFLPENEDPDSLVRKEGATIFKTRIREQTLGLADYFFQTLRQGIDLQRIDGRARLASRAQPLLARIPKGLISQLMLSRLSELVDSLLHNPLPARRNIRQPSAPSVSLPRLSPSRATTALTLLVHKPELALLPELKLDFLENLELPGATLLQQTIACIQQHQTSSPAALLEHFRGHEECLILEDLLARDLFVEDENMAPQFQQALQLLQQQKLKQQIDQLLQRNRQSPLNTEERNQLLQLMQQRKVSPLSDQK